jgi:hypothetical protein
MNNVLEKLEQILSVEIEVHDIFLAAAHEFNAAIKNQNLADIDRQRAIHDETICRIEQLENERISCCTVLAGSLGIVKKPLKLGMLLEKVPQQWRNRLGSLQMALKSKIGELSKISTSNRILLEEGLRVVGSTFSFVQQAAGSRYAAYGKHGRSVAGPALQSMVNRIA